MITVAQKRYFGLVFAGILFFGLGSFPRYFRHKQLKSFSFLAPGICPLVNLPSIKEPARPRYPLIRMKT